MSLGAVQFPHLGDSAWILHIIILWNKLERRIGVDIERVVDGIGIEDASVLQGSFDVIAHVVGGATPDKPADFDFGARKQIFACFAH